MRNFSNLSLLLLTITLLTSCGKEGYKFKLNSPKKTAIGKTIPISFQQLEGKKIDSLHIYVDNQFLSKKTAYSINTENIGIGKHTVTALAFYPGNVKKTINTLEVVAKKAPSVYKYKIINTYTHDKKAYTQGLEYHNGFLYETTGRKGQSWLRKVELETGKVLLQKDLSKNYFGEGMTIFNNTIYWLTWQANKGFTYNLDDFNKTGEFKYGKSLEGWGLTHNESELIKSDGTHKIWFLDPISKKEKRSIQAYTNNQSVDKLNELELVNDKIYANKWQQNSIVVIDAKTGAIDAVIDLNGLKKIVSQDQKLDPSDDVLNGIAYDSKNNRLFVTGKHWGKLFEIELIK